MACNGKEEIKTLMTHAELTADVTAARIKAMESGLDKADVIAVLTRLAELLEADS
jgi:hypothetical protein